MSSERWIRLIAALLILGSVALGTWVHKYWYFFTAFVGLNLFRSALTRWCLLEDILRKVFEVKSEAELNSSCSAKH